jgi:hypothetical protein
LNCPDSTPIFFVLISDKDDKNVFNVAFSKWNVCPILQALPSDNWCCANCSCKFCHEHSSSRDAEDIAGVDSSLHTCSQCEEKCM